tara:strand:- start:2832 stop:3026 length:195 start_codon:yes stop_codon:yes gene_type:complete
MIETIINLLTLVTTMVTVASAVAATTPTPKDDELIGKLYKFVDLLALNIGKAKEQAPVKKVTKK